MKDEVDPAPPLRGLNGAVPPAPDWFCSAIDAPFDSGHVESGGAMIEYRAWGDQGKPGLLLFHGNGAHLGWWSFLAPLLSDTHRVVAFSLSGMGQSSWRDGTYRVGDYVQEGLAAAEAGGAYACGPPVFVGHSVGGLPVMRAAARCPERLRAAIIVDCGMPGPDMIEVAQLTRARTYPDLASALDRFRLSPPQPCENLYIADYLARMAVKQDNDGRWSWRFDRRLWGDLDVGDPWADLATVRAPLAVIRGEFSALSGGATLQRMKEVAPEGTPFIDIPSACHHVMIDQPLALVASLRTLLAAWA